MKMEGATPLECGMVILTVFEGNSCAKAQEAAASNAKPIRERSAKRT